MHGIDLYWLPENPRWAEQLADVAGQSPGLGTWPALVGLAQNRLSALQTMQLDRRRTRLLPSAPTDLSTTPVRLAILASSTVEHLLPALRVGGLRRSMFVDTYTPDYGQYTQELLDHASGLHRFNPDVVLFTFDAHHVMGRIEPGMTADAVSDALERALDRLTSQWKAARRAFSGQILQTVPLPVFLPVLGSNEHRLPSSRLAALKAFSASLRTRADAASVDVIALDDRVALDGLAAWHDPALWHRAKQEIHPQAAPLFGDMVMREIAAARGLSRKCLVLDLDNTLWGGVIGDDGLAGIKLGQGSARGEAHLAFQHYVRDLSRRGVILAVCSKNDEKNALEPFTSHPEMVLKQEDIACFVANWTDKATNLRQIAARLNIGLDSLVFADDNPAERAVVRRELPMVAVPELPEDPTSYAACLADAGYFEALRVTAEDGQRAEQYRQNAARDEAAGAATDMDGYLRSLEMRAVWDRFDQTGLSRIVQLINKTNQFNLTTRRFNEDEIRARIGDPATLTLQVRLLDQFGDNGIVVIVAGIFDLGTADIRLDTWLMSCRVLGRGLEVETLNLVVAEAIRVGARRLIGIYRPTPKNAMVRDHYERLGFTRMPGEDAWVLDIASYDQRPTFISSRRSGAISSSLTPA